MTPALATRTSMGPSSALDRADGLVDRLGVGDVAGHAEQAATGPDRVVTATRSPPAAKAAAMARPMPRLPPVTRTTRPGSSAT